MFGKTEELLIVLAIILVLFGGKKLPELARSLGQSVKEIRKGFSDDETASTTSKKEASENEA
ncbi:MAG: twin-arginine translocase TatA/TatE family subunit [Candidatus Saccharimonadales bacterium]